MKTQESSLKLWEVDDGEQHWYSAITKERALELYLEPLRNQAGELDKDSLGCLIEEIEISEISPDTILPVRQDDSKTVVKKTAAEWVADGEGFVASTVW